MISIYSIGLITSRRPDLRLQPVRGAREPAPPAPLLPADAVLLGRVPLRSRPRGLRRPGGRGLRLQGRAARRHAIPGVMRPASSS